MYYTDLEFTDEQKQDILSLFDMFEGNGVIDAVKSGILKESRIDESLQRIFKVKSLIGN